MCAKPSIGPTQARPAPLEYFGLGLEMRSRQRGIVKVCQRIAGDSHQKRLTLKWLSHLPVGGRGCLLLVPSKEASKSSLSQMQSPSLGTTLPFGPLFLHHVSFPLPFFLFFPFPPPFIAHEKNESDGTQTCSAWSSALPQSL